MTDEGEQATPLIFFLNPNSGAGLAGDLKRAVESLPGVFIAELPRDRETWAQTFHDQLQHPNCRLVACGGDGTVNWVVSLCNAVYGPGDREGRPALAVIPFGTGNDMSRSLGWGTGMTQRDISRVKRRVKDLRRSTVVKQIDIWKVVIAEEGHDEVSLQMMNYCSVGVDAEIALDFENCRNGSCRCCFCCHCMSLCCYVPVGMGNACCKRAIRDYCQAVIDEVTPDGQTVARTLTPAASDKTLIFQAIPNMYGGADPWHNFRERAMDDRKVEVIFQGGMFKIGLVQVGFPTGTPVCQASKATITITEPAHFQLDGEARFINNPSTITMERSGSYPMVFARGFGGGGEPEDGPQA